ncbi:MAG: hypothetical protein WKG07_31965 [Hymenobacter sp.]
MLVQLLTFTPTEYFSFVDTETPACLPTGTGPDAELAWPHGAGGPQLVYTAGELVKTENHYITERR